MGCSQPSTLISPSVSPEKIAYSAIYIIHADADYLFHDENGQALQADEKVLAEARKVGEQAKKGEVFIFHQKQETKILWLFPRKDRLMLHYRNGELVTAGRYSPGKYGENIFEMETKLYSQNSTISDSASRVFLYFGHEIPEKGGEGYHQSQKNLVVNAETFSGGVNDFLNGRDDLFELVVLSTCNNGNPQMAKLLHPFSSTLLASPQNLHLSHIDTEALLLLESDGEIAVGQLATTMAEQTFERLSTSIQTEISLFVYEMDKINGYLSEMDSLHQKHLKETDPKHFEENVDCADISLFKDLDFSAGVTGWYRPAKFGRRAGSDSHSGWGCKPQS